MNAQLEAESKLSLPMWLVESLQKRGHLELQMPEFYGNAYRQALRADAPHLDLRAQSDYYFDIGIHLSQMCAPRHPPTPAPCPLPPTVPCVG